ncbi:hypothetical protein LTR94_035814, partial [Friedmanniomyces endolithicus]
ASAGRPAGRVAGLQLGDRSRLFRGRGRGRLAQRQYDGPAEAVGPVDARRLQPLQRRLRGDHQLWRLLAQFAGGDRRHRLRPAPGVAHDSDHGGLQAVARRPVPTVGRA